MDYDVIEARYVSGYVIWLKFRDGTQGEIDLAAELSGPVFEPLRDPALFRQVSLDAFGAPCWPNGADLAPDALYRQIRGQ